MLLYHPFFDPHHCVFRILRLLEKAGPVEIEVQRLRIWDFYLLFPTAINEAQLPKGQTAIRRVVKRMENRYESLPDSRRAFTRLEPIQSAALAHLSAIGVIDAQQLVEGKVLRTGMALPSELNELIKNRNAEATGVSILDFLTSAFLELPLYGDKGVRYRTDLFDHRYDIP